MNKEKLETARNLFLIALALDIAITTLVVISDFWGVSVLKDISAGRISADQSTISTLEFWDSFAKLMLLTMLGVGIGLVKWLNACYSFAKESIGASGFKQEGWTTSGWIIPIFNLFKPYLVINEIYKAGSAGYALPDGWKKVSGSGLLLAWWIFWVVTHLIGWLVGKLMLKSAMRDDMTLQQAISSTEFHAWFCIVFLGVSVLWLVVASNLSRRLLNRETEAQQKPLSVQFGSLHKSSEVQSQLRPIAQTTKITDSLQKPSENQIVAKTPEVKIDPHDFSNRNPPDAIAEERYWEIAMTEMEVGPRKAGIWAKSFAESDGDETKAKVAYLRTRVAQQLEAAHLEMAMLEEQHLQLPIVESGLADEVPEFRELISEGYVPIGKHESHGLVVRELANGIIAIETKRQQRCYKDIDAARSAIYEFVNYNRWTARRLVVAIERAPSSDESAHK
jgi:hypothetical protein